MINSNFLKQRLEYIDLYLRDLDVILEVPREQLKADIFRRYAAERLFQLIVDEMTDANTHIIRYAELETPDDFQSTFRILAEHGILLAAFAERIAPVVGLRNILVHRYETINKDLFIKTVYDEKNDFREYIRLIHEYIAKTEQPAS